MAAWSAEFFAGHADYMLSSFLPVVDTVAFLADVDQATAGLRLQNFVHDYCQASADSLERDTSPEQLTEQITSLIFEED